MTLIVSSGTANASSGTANASSEVLTERLRIAELVGQVSRHFVDLPARDVQKGIDGALRSIVESLSLHSALVAVLVHDDTAFRITHRFAGTSFESWLFPLGRELPLAELPWLSARILERTPVVITPESPLPQEAVKEQESYAHIETAWRAFFPLDAGGAVLGCVSFVGNEPWNPHHREGLRILSEIFAAALDRQRVEDLLQQRYRQVELVGDVSRRFIDLPAAKLGSGIDETLRSIAELHGFMRASVYEISDDGTTFAITHRYLAVGIEPLVPLHAPRPLESFSYVLSRLEAGHPIVLSPDNLPPSADAEREALSEREHAVVFPLTIGGKVLGAVTFGMPDAPSPALVASLRVVGELFSAALERERTDLALAERLRFEEALSEISAQLVRSRGEALGRAVLDALGSVGRALEFDRVSLFELTGGRRFFSLSNEWCADGIRSFSGSMSGLEIDAFGWPLTELREGRAVVIGLADIPPEGKNASRVLSRDGTKVFATVPLVVGGEVLGCIGFHRIRSARGLSDHQLRRLRLVGEMVADAMGRHSVEGSLKQSEARLAKVIASALDGFAIVNEAGVILEWTPQSERILGFPRGEMLGGSIWDVVGNMKAGKHKAGFPIDWDQLSRRNPGGRVELQGRHRDGREIPIELSISAIDEGTPSRYALFIRDITDRKRAEQVRHQAFEEIARLKAQIEGERDYLREEIRTEHQVGEFVGRSTGLRNVLNLVESVASTSATVLIRGESGVGKELVARAIHAQSARADGPLVKVNCASIPKELFESEFFGHVRGAFTGAQKDRAGRFELADKGTLFLDEVGEIPLALQSKLLRVLQEGEFERVGDDRTRRVDVRIVAATNRDLAVEAGAGTFRKDLYYRLSVFPVEVPPLRQRREDIVPLAEHFLRVLSRDLGRNGLVFEDAQRRMLESYDWPGNVRELSHVIERAVILSKKPPLRLEPALHTGGSPSATESPAHVLTEAELRALERQNIVAALEHAGWRISGEGGAADALGINASTLRDRMRSFDIKRSAE